MAGLHSNHTRKPGKKPEKPATSDLEALPRRARRIDSPQAGAVVELLLTGTVTLPATVSRVQDDLIWIRMPPVVPNGHSFSFSWATTDGARESTADAITHSGDHGMMARMQSTHRVDRKHYDRIPPNRPVFVRAVLFDVAGEGTVGTIFGQVADASFNDACFRTAGAPSIGQTMVLYFRDDESEQIGDPLPAKVLSVTLETSKSRLVRVSFGRVGLKAQTIRDVIMGGSRAANAA